MPDPLTGAWSSVPPSAARPGVDLRVVWLDGLMLGHAELAPGADAGSHAHAEEQIGTVLAGSIRLTVEGVERALGAGEHYRLPADAEHRVVGGPEGASLVEAWSPPRAPLKAG
jgi:quercetin dioxygenase-like cupin family protein